MKCLDAEAHANGSCELSHRRDWKLTLTAVPAKAPGYICGLDCPLLTRLEQNE